MLKITAHIEGTAPLLMHNPRLADPLDPYAKAMKVISSNRRKTEEMYEEMARLEYLGGLYWDAKIGPYLPSTVLTSNLVRGAMARRGAKKLAQSAFFIEDPINPLLYNGPRDVESLLADANFRLVAPVRVQAARVMRTRPCFREWSCEFTVQLDTEIISFEDFESAIDRAGSIEGIGDWRPQYGRYNVKELVKETMI